MRGTLAGQVLASGMRYVMFVTAGEAIASTGSSVNREEEIWDWTSFALEIPDLTRH